MSTNQNNSNPPKNKTITINTTNTGSGNGFVNVVIPPNAWFNYNPFGYIPPTVDESTEEIKDDRDGCTCKKCKEFYPYAESNQKDKSFVCYSCRNGY